jgi:hypothetical protein
VTGSGRLRDGCGPTKVRVTALIGQNISSRLHCGEGNWGQIHLSCFPGPESNGSSLRGMLLLPSGSGGSTLTHLPQSSHWAKVSVATAGSLLVDISIVAHLSLSEENITPLPSRLALAMSATLLCLPLSLPLPLLSLLSAARLFT